MRACTEAVGLFCAQAMRLGLYGRPSISSGLPDLGLVGTDHLKSVTSVPDLGYAGLLYAVRRQRVYPQLERHGTTLGAAEGLPPGDGLAPPGATNEPLQPRVKLGPGTKGGLLSIFDETKVLASNIPATTVVIAPQLRLIDEDRTTSSLTFVWDDPADLGGAEVYQYELEVPAHDTQYVPARDEFWQGHREFKTVPLSHPRTRRYVLHGLEADNSYRCRVRGLTEAGTSSWSEVVEVTTLAPSQEDSEDRRESAVVPRAWLQADVADIIAEQLELHPETASPAGFLKQVAASLLPLVFSLRRIFYFYARSGAASWCICVGHT